MSEFKVKKGDIVKKSQVIGLSGDTGRITGPHLHFSTRVGGLQVDPLELITLLNTNLYWSSQYYKCKIRYNFLTNKINYFKAKLLIIKKS